MTDSGGVRAAPRAFRSGANGAPAITPRHTKQFARRVEFILNYSCGLLPQAALKNGVHRREYSADNSAGCFDDTLQSLPILSVALPYQTVMESVNHTQIDSDSREVFF